MSYAIAKRVILEERVCIRCGVDFAIPEEMLSNFVRLGGFYYCPNGHSQGWDKGTEHTKIKTLERELEQERERKRLALARENEALAQLSKAEAKIEKQKKRTRAGLCPCCNRTFSQLARHMATKHPEAKK